MSERKVLNKYYPPDFPGQLPRARKRSKNPTKLQTVRLMAPFTMKCLTCGEYIYKGRTFNARKDARSKQHYLNILIMFFHIRCTRCSAEITFRTDPKNRDYAMVRGAMRNTEPWRNTQLTNETDSERLDRLEAEKEVESESVDDSMQALEERANNAQNEIVIADALDRIRVQNAARARTEVPITDGALSEDKKILEEEQDRLDAEEARRAFQRKYSHGTQLMIRDKEVSKEGVLGQLLDTSNKKPGDRAQIESIAPPVFPKKKTRNKKDYAAALGLKRKK